MEDALNTILKDTYGLSQLKRRLLILKSQLLIKFFGGQSSEPITETDSKWLKSLPSEFLNGFNKDNVYKIFEDSEKTLTFLKPVTIYLTFEPDDTSIASIGSYAKKAFSNPLLLLDIKYDPNLIAGAALVWKGVYRDYSLRSRIDERKLAILESFKKFLR